MTRPAHEAFRKALSRFATGVTVVTVDRPGDEGAHGMTANAFASVSLEPMLVLVCIGRKAHAHALVRREKRFGISVLTEDQEALARHFAQPNQHPSDEARLHFRFARTKRGTPYIEGALALLECRLVSEFAAGDHTVFIGAVEDMHSSEGRPLLYYRGKYRRLPPVETG
jgi:flavin reductase